MARFTAHREIEAPADVVWARVTDWRSHARWVPLTTMTITHDADGVGTRFVGRSGAGVMAFDDPMEVVRFDPPTSSRAGTAGIAHRGRVILGSAEVQVVPLPGGRCRVRWTEEVAVFSRGLSRAFTLPLVLGGRLAFGHVLAQIDQELTAERAGGGSSGAASGRSSGTDPGE